MTTTDATDALPVRRRGPSMADVAREAGVSGQTVSRVSNGRSNVDADTRERVLAAMRKLGYRPEQRRPGAAQRAVPQHRRDHVHPVQLRQHAHARRDRGRGHGCRVLDHAHPRAAPDPGRGLGRVRPARRAGRRRRHHHRRGAPARRERRRAARGPAGRRRRLHRRRPLPDGRHRPGARRPAGHRAPARPRTPHGLARRRARAVVLGRRAAARRGRRRCASTAPTVPPVLVGDWSAESGYELGLELAATPTSRRSSRRTTRWRSACCAPCTSAAARCPATSASSASTTWRSPRSFWPPLTTVRQFFAEVGRRSVEALLHEVETGERGGSTLVATELSCATARRGRRPDRDGAMRAAAGKRHAAMLADPFREAHDGRDGGDRPSRTHRLLHRRIVDRPLERRTRRRRDRRRIHPRRDHRIMDPVALGRRSREHHVGASGLGIPLGAPRHGRRGARALLRDAARVDRARGRLAVRRRVPSGIAIGAASAGLYLLVRRRATREMAVIAAVVVAVLPRVTFLATEARSLALATAAAVWLTLLLLRLLDGSDAPGLVVGLCARARTRQLPLPVPRVAHPGARRRRRPRAAWFEAAAGHPDPSLPARLGGRRAPHRPDRRGRRGAAQTRSRSAGRIARSRRRGCSSTSGSCSRHSRSSRGRSSSCRSPSSSTVARTRGTATVSSSSSAERGSSCRRLR